MHRGCACRSIGVGAYRCGMLATSRLAGPSADSDCSTQVKADARCAYVSWKACVSVEMGACERCRKSWRRGQRRLGCIDLCQGQRDRLHPHLKFLAVIQLDVGALEKNPLELLQASQVRVLS